MESLTQTNIRAIIFYLWKKGYSPIKTYQEMVEVLGLASPSQQTIYRWFTKFSDGIQSFEDLPRSGRLITQSTSENINAIKDVIKNNRRITVKKIEQELEIPTTTVHTILHSSLQLKKVCSRWIPHELTLEQKLQRIEFCQQFLEKFKNPQSKSLYNIVTGDETYIYYYDPLNKKDSKEWRYKNQSPPLKVKKSISTKKVMMIVFFSKVGIELSISVPRKKKLNSQFLIRNCLSSVFEKYSSRHPKSKLSRMLLHWDNASTHKSQETLNFLSTKSVQILKHPPYSPDLSPCDFWLFSKIKNFLKGKIFTCDSELVSAFNNELRKLTKDDFNYCFNLWFKQVDRCLQNNGNYFVNY
jgi:[histone H3]-lysine36 N-dimethyltransferase SETMAR